MAKRDLKAGEELDGIGGFTCYGAIENSDVCRAGNLLPMGLSQGCHLKRDVPRDYAITYDDVDPDAHSHTHAITYDDANPDAHSHTHARREPTDYGAFPRCGLG